MRNHRIDFGVALGCGVISGLLPAWRTRGGALSPALHRLANRPAGTCQGLRFHGLRSVLVVAETALALILLVGAGLMVHSFVRLRTTEVGFEPKQLLTLRLDQPRGASDQDRQLFCRQVLEHLRVSADIVPGW